MEKECFEGAFDLGGLWVEWLWFKSLEFGNIAGSLLLALIDQDRLVHIANSLVSSRKLLFPHLLITKGIVQLLKYQRRCLN